MVHRSVTYVPGLYKIFDEILVNAADNKQRDPSMDSLKVTIDPEGNTVSVYNNGDGVPVELHQEEKVYVPELIFGHLLTTGGRNGYDDNVKKTTGGRNGYGAKLTNIFSTEFVIETADGRRQKKYKHTAELPPDLAKNLMHALHLTQPQVKSLLLELKPHYVFFDFAQNWLPKLASEVGVKSVHFSVYSAISDSYITVPSRLVDVEGKTITFEDLKNPPPGYPQKSNISLKAFEAMDFMFLFKRFGDDLTGYERVLQSLSECSYVVFKSCKEIEGVYIDYIEKQFGKQVLLAGPLVPEPSMDVLEEKWLKWLDNFPSKSVIFCSFGSETFLNDDQIKELATGLELTGLPFILVLNFPTNLNPQAELESERALPKGFLERVKERGVVHSGWLQQQLILKHSSVGCYVCHGGFSSVIEAMVNDCQLVLLPFKGDQFFNSKLIAKDLEAGIEVNRKEEDGYFHKEDVLKAVKSIMVEDDKEPGKRIRENHVKWREFLLNKEIQDKFITDLVAQLKSLA